MPLPAAARTRACVREADTVARIGGDEIAILLLGAAMYAAKAAGGNGYRFWVKPQARLES